MGPVSAEHFKNCSNLTDVTAIALARGITAAVCAVASLTALVILALMNCCHHRVCGTVIKRLVVGYLASNVPFQLVLALHLIYYFHPEQENFCKADGFFRQYVESVQFVFLLEINLVLFLRVCEVTTSWKCQATGTFTCCCWKINKLDTVLFVSVFCLPLLFDWIPFTTGSYGPYGPWCWIRSFNNDCSPTAAGYLEQILLQDVPVFILGPLTLGLLFICLCLLCYTIKTGKVKKLNKVGITDSILSLVLMFASYLLSIIFVIQFERFTIWMVRAIFGPLLTTLIALTLLIAIHLPLSCMVSRVCCNCYEHTYTESDQATLHTSSLIQQPSYTTWNPSHSINTTSRSLLLTCDMHPQDYGSIA